MSLISKLKTVKALKEIKRLDEETPDFINTGALPLNLLFSGELDGGIPIGKVSMLATPSSYGKSLIGLQISRYAQKKDIDVIYIDTEYAFSHTYAKNIGIDENKLILIQEARIEKIQSILFQMLDKLEQDERKNVLVVIDNFSNTVTAKTEEDILSSKDTVDMTISKKRNQFAKMLINYKGVTVFVINSVYASMDMYNPLAISGGSGIYYVSSSVVLGSSKAKKKDGTEVEGAIITAKTVKGRFSKELSKLKYLIKYDTSIHPVYGILDDLIEFGFVYKPSMGWYSRDFSKLGLEGEDKKWREKEIFNNWKEFFSFLKNPDVKNAFKSKYTYVDSAPAIEDDIEDIL